MAEKRQALIGKAERRQALIGKAERRQTLIGKTKRGKRGEERQKEGRDEGVVCGCVRVEKEKKKEEKYGSLIDESQRKGVF